MDKRTGFPGRSTVALLGAAVLLQGCVVVFAKYEENYGPDEPAVVATKVTLGAGKPSNHLPKGATQERASADDCAAKYPDECCPPQECGTTPDDDE